MKGPRKTIGILFGGRSAEHEVSKQSAANVVRALNPKQYDIILIGIDRVGRWLLCDNYNGLDAGNQALDIPENSPLVTFIPGSNGIMIVLDEAKAASSSHRQLDVILPILHGPNGEDGTVQGFLELINIPYIGSGVMGAAASIDKEVAKRLLRDSGIPVVPFVAAASRNRMDYEEAVQILGTPELFVKPASMGSSIGVSRVRSADEFEDACDHAFRYDEKVLVEQSAAKMREIECSVLEDASGEIWASPLGEIVPDASHGFYSYDAKYIDESGALLRIPADLAPDLVRQVQSVAINTFRILGCEGMARVDFFVSSNNEGHLFVNEVNTLPGFTAISMYPKLWEYAGVPTENLMEVLIGHAIARHQRRNHLRIDLMG